VVRICFEKNAMLTASIQIGEMCVHTMGLYHIDRYSSSERQPTSSQHQPPLGPQFFTFFCRHWPRASCLPNFASTTAACEHHVCGLLIILLSSAKEFSSRPAWMSADQSLLPVWHFALRAQWHSSKSGNWTTRGRPDHLSSPIVLLWTVTDDVREQPSTFSVDAR